MTSARKDHARLREIMRRSARFEVNPCFRNLAAGDICQKKSAIDVVTDADEAAGRDIALAIEAHLGLGLRTLLLPGDQDAMIH